MANEDQISLSDDPEVETLVPIKGRDRKFGRYDLGYEIASGGMASVFLARARGPGGFDRLVAIKKIHPHLAKQKEFVEMFLDEARLAARINHPNVCSVFDFGEVDGSYYMAMEYLVGQPLSAVLRAAYHRPDLACTRQWQVLAARIIADACEGLHSAHELSDDRGRPLSVVHRDVTPQNLFVTYDGAVKVVDFGVAWAHGRMHETRTGVVKGKFAYMAPEQLQSRSIDRRLDVWALGVCLWELLALKRLFGRRSDAELVLAVVGDTIEPPSSVQPTVPAALDAIVMRALQRDPDARYPTARAMSRELNAFIHASGTPAGLPELADLMRDLVPNERTRKLGVVSTLLDAPPPPSGESPISDSPGTDSPSHSGARPVPHDALTTTRFQGVPKPGPVAPPDLHERTVPDEGAPQSPPESAVAPRPFPWAQVLAFAGVLVMAAVVGLIAALSVTRDPPPRASTTIVLGVNDLEPPRPSPQSEFRQAYPQVELPRSSLQANLPRDEPSPLPAPVPATVTADEPPSVIEPSRGSTRTRTSGRTKVSELRPLPAGTTQRARATGTVSVRAQGGWAGVYVDGRFVRDTPTVLTLEVGTHTIELRRPDQPTIRRVIDVTRGPNPPVIVALR